MSSEANEVNVEQQTKVIFKEFNSVRSMRDAPAARFLVINEDGDEYLLWMSASDIKANIKDFPECKEELLKGLACYGQR